MAGSEKRFKIWSATESSQAGAMVTEKEAFLVGTPKNFVVASDSGIGLMGKSVTFGTTSENIRSGGMFLKMNNFVRMIPSTFATPIPPEIPFPPIALFTSVIKDMPFVFALMFGG